MVMYFVSCTTSPLLKQCGVHTSSPVVMYLLEMPVKTRRMHDTAYRRLHAVASEQRTIAGKAARCDTTGIKISMQKQETGRLQRYEGHMSSDILARMGALSDKRSSQWICSLSRAWQNEWAEGQ
jgi:hypothetical protein